MSVQGIDTSGVRGSDFAFFFLSSLHPDFDIWRATRPVPLEILLRPLGPSTTPCYPVLAPALARYLGSSQDTNPAIALGGYSDLGGRGRLASPFCSSLPGLRLDQQCRFLSFVILILLAAHLCQRNPKRPLWSSHRTGRPTAHPAISQHPRPKWDGYRGDGWTRLWNGTGAHKALFSFLFGWSSDLLLSFHHPFTEMGRKFIRPGNAPDGSCS